MWGEGGGGAKEPADGPTEKQTHEQTLNKETETDAEKTDKLIDGRKY